MPPKHRAERGTSRETSDLRADTTAARPRPWRRRFGWVAAAVIASAVVLGGVVVAGCRSGANACLGKKYEAGATGAEIFARNCASCHGLQGQGGRGPAFVAGGPLGGLTFGQRVEKIGRGKPLNAMPRWRGKLSAEQIRMVAAYTQILSGQQPEPSVAGVR
ncbi:MAG: Cytochrome oxidase, cbb3-type, subunit [Frankiaceae bacterium]|jgi:mono/diheme cytochrome c family protein|nr:Cytochrome oxidase, cbb3-type, subunit [Frankiaceae bacterium]